MNILAAICGVMIVGLGFWSMGSSPTDAQFGTQITCLVGGLILCFLAVTLSRLRTLQRTLDGFQPEEEPPE